MSKQIPASIPSASIGSRTHFWNLSNGALQPQSWTNRCCLCLVAGSDANTISHPGERIGVTQSPGGLMVRGRLTRPVELMVQIRLTQPAELTVRYHRAAC
jgi:hypothetical protein